MATSMSQDPLTTSALTTLGDYERFDLIVTGRLWSVYEGGDHRLDREVAIKVLDHSDPFSNEIDTDYWDGLRALAALSHEGITSIYDLDPERGWIVMQRAESDLATQHRNKTIKSDEIVRLLTQVASGLSQLHAIGRLHGAITPSNLLVDAQGNIRLNASPGVAIGGETAIPSPEQRHIAPELINPQEFGKPGPASDLYCLGFVAIELLLGKRFKQLVPGLDKSDWIPWHASSATALPALAERIPDVPEALIRVLAKLTAKRVEDRYTSAERLLTDLASCGGRTTVSSLATATAPQPSFVERLSDIDRWQEAIHSPAFLAKIAGSLVAFCLIITVITASTTTKKATLNCISSAEGEVVFATGERGVTNQEIEMPAGSYRFTIKANGYEPFQGSVTLIDGEQRELAIDLTLLAQEALDEASPVPLIIRTNPENALVTVSGRPTFPLEGLSGWSLDVVPGEYEVVTKCEGYETEVRQIRVKENGPTFHEIALRPALFDVRIISRPAKATIFLDGKKQSLRSPLTLRVEPGKHEIALEYEGHKFWKETLEIENRGTSLKVELEKIVVPHATYTVTFRSEPAGVDLFIDDHRVGSTPMRIDLAPGLHSVLLTHPSRQPVRSNVDVRSDGDVFFLQLSRGKSPLPTTPKTYKNTPLLTAASTVGR